LKRVASETERPEQTAETHRAADLRNAQKRSISIKLGGKEYRLRSDADEEWLQQVAAFVDKSMQNIRERTDTVDSLDIALLAALNLARELLQEREDAKDSPEGGIGAERLRDLIELVETEVDDMSSAAV
jgi:cell division protein ZapA (FtsZ GTPase activity inhibitor)